jgi:hypothetical protein
MKLRVLVALGALGLAGCTPDWATQNNSSLIMRITQIVGVPGASGGPTSGTGFLFSDVVSASGIFNDNATLTVQLIRKDQTAPDSRYEDVTLTRYEVQYYRTDGRNVEGKDVPYRTTGVLNQTVASPAGNQSASVDVTITVVRQQAKLESPLLELKNITTDTSVLNSNPQLAGAGILTCIARITVYGVSTNDRAVSATGELNVTFANFAG